MADIMHVVAVLDGAQDTLDNLGRILCTCIFTIHKPANILINNAHNIYHNCYPFRVVALCALRFLNDAVE